MENLESEINVLFSEKFLVVQPPLSKETHP